jgi:hypothetical protein
VNLNIYLRGLDVERDLENKEQIFIYTEGYAEYMFEIVQERLLMILLITYGSYTIAIRKNRNGRNVISSGTDVVSWIFVFRSTY